MSKLIGNKPNQVPSNGDLGSLAYQQGDKIANSLIPGVSDTYDLGAADYVWRNIYTGDLQLSNEGHEQGNDVDGTKGAWTIQEGEEDLYIINRKNGKKYKFVLQEIE